MILAAVSLCIDPKEVEFSPWQRVDPVHQCAWRQPGCGRGHDGGGRFFHRERRPGSHPPEDGTSDMSTNYLVSLSKK